MLLLFFVFPHLHTDPQLGHDPPGDPLLPAGSPGHWAFTGAGSTSASVTHQLTIICFSCYQISTPLNTQVRGHGAVVFPPPRNNVDHGEQPWAGQVSCDWWRASHVTSILISNWCSGSTCGWMTRARRASSPRRSTSTT